ncbi:glycosyltransferase family 4 protein [uncultured Catenibacterium sp.]|uniref:glycosyltransferase family 4 protein n=1 Tax=uncultured Catenibacterium sp. TaxID=286142 RepID=UPI0025D5ADA1|nr:glycosyltransferase family 4 protein [uncultured Catenibacterium sp.]
MNVLFLTTGRIDSIEQHSIYPDLLRYFRDQGHNVYTVGSYEKREGKETELKEDHGAKMLYVKIGNLTQTNLIEKGVSTVRVESQYLSAIKKYFSDVKFDLVLYSTPPITLVKVVEYVKRRDGAKTYLLLKDIFPQNAVDLGMMRKNGLKGLLYKYFRKKEKNLYKVSDYIGCMSQANIDYVISHNPEVDLSIVEICPNCVEPLDKSVSLDKRIAIRNKYDIPLDKKVFIYGGNLGKPQGIPFLIECLKSQKDNNNVHFVVVGSGTEYSKLESFIKEYKPTNVKLMKRLPKEDYDTMVGACDVGMIFLDHRFTIPNFPSRLLSYMQAKIPVLAVTDSNTDIGNVIVEGGFGWWCESNDVNNFDKLVSKINLDKLEEQKVLEYSFLEENYSVEQAYNTIMSHFGIQSL